MEILILLILFVIFINWWSQTDPANNKSITKESKLIKKKSNISNEEKELIEKAKKESKEWHNKYGSLEKFEKNKDNLEVNCDRCDIIFYVDNDTFQNTIHGFGDKPLECSECKKKRFELKGKTIVDIKKYLATKNIEWIPEDDELSDKFSEGDLEGYLDFNKLVRRCQDCKNQFRTFNEYAMRCDKCTDYLLDRG